MLKIKKVKTKRGLMYRVVSDKGSRSLGDYCDRTKAEQRIKAIERHGRKIGRANKGK